MKIEIDTLKKINNDNEGINLKIKEKEILLETCLNNLKKLSDSKIEYRLYVALMNGLKPSKAVEKIAQENYLNDIYPSSISSIWRIYKNMKKNIKI